MYPRARKLGFGTLFLVSLVSCRFQQRPLGWYEPTAGEMSLGCLDGALETLTHFIQGKAAAQDAKDVFSCADTSLVMFTGMISGSEPGSYSAAELRNLLQTVFLKQFKITDALFNESLRLKQAFLGGDAQKFSAGDIKRLRKLLAMLGDHAGQMVHDQPLLPETVEQWQPERMDEALARVYNAGEQLASWIDEASGSYKFSEFESLLTRLEETGLLAGTDSGKLVQDIRKWLPFVRLTKSLLVDGNQDELKAKDWGTLVRMGARAYSVVLRISNLSKNATTWTMGDDRARLVGLGRNFLHLLKDAIENRESHAITSAELSRLFDLLPFEVSLNKRLVFSALPHVLDRFFGNPTPVLNGQLAPTQIDRDRLGRIIGDFENWAQTQEMLERKYIGPRAVSESYRPYESPLLTLGDGVTHNALASLEDTAHAPVYLFQSSDTPTYRVHLSGYNSVGKRGVADLTARNWTKAVARIIIRGYSPRVDHWQERKLTFDDFWHMFLDFKPILAAAGMLNSGYAINKTTLDELFHLTDIVNFSSDGDAKVDERELSDELIIFLSSSEMGTTLQNLAEDSCKLPTAACVRTVLLHNFELIFQSFPDLLTDWRSWSLADRMKTLEYAQYLALKRDKPDNEFFVASEYMALTNSWHQLELMFARYDLNHDRVGSEDEVLRSFPLFKDLLKSMALQQGGSMGALVDGHLLESLFTHIAAKDEDPQKNVFSLLTWNFFPDMRKKNTRIVRKDLIRRFEYQRRTYPPIVP